MFLLLLMAAMVMPATIQAKKIKYSKFLVYEGDVANQVPSGEGVLTMSTSQSTETLKGTFNNTTVTDAVLTLENGWLFKGNLSYSLQLSGKPNYITYELGDGELSNQRDVTVKTTLSTPTSVMTVLVEDKLLSTPVLGSVLVDPIDLGEVEIDKDRFGSEIGGYKLNVLEKFGAPQAAKYFANNRLEKIFETKYYLAYVLYDDGGRLSKNGYERTNGDFLRNDYESYQDKINRNPNGNVTFPDYQGWTCHLSYIDGTISYDGTTFDARYTDKDGNDWPIRVDEYDHIRITYSDGSSFEGSVEYNGKQAEAADMPLLKFSRISDLNLKYRDGSFTDAKGEKIPYYNGYGRSEIEASTAKNREKRIANEKKEQKAYDALCKEYGKKYVDAALSKQIIVGMPEELLLARFGHQLERFHESESYKSYYWKVPKVIFDKYESDHYTRIVSVSDGKVSSITY